MPYKASTKHPKALENDGIEVFDEVRLSRILLNVNTIVETKMFSAKAAKVWTPKQYEDFVVHIGNNPNAGEIVTGSGGVRKIRWGKGGTGKRGGVRVVYFNTAAEETWLLTMYAKNERENIPAHELKKIKEAIDG